jgi:hypothetical protein
MNARKSGFRSLLYTLILTTTALFVHVSSWANLAPSGIAAEAAAPGSSRAADMKTIQTALESKALRGRLKSMGLGDAEVETRLKNLSDKEIHQLASQIEAVRPGGLVVELLLVVVLVLVILYLVKRV